MRFILLAALIAPLASAAVAGVDIEARVEAVAQHSAPPLSKASTAAIVFGPTATATSSPLSESTITFMNARPLGPAATMVWEATAALELLDADED
ncbi:hypothetical protein TrVGV298_006222 [Trichoderma virens]|nr:hypothetical protein TrVGV298_006222 [Trichoderma virens]